MYDKLASKREVFLWCDGKDKDSDTVANMQSSRKRLSETTSSSKCQEKEEEVDEIFQDLKERHPGNEFSTLQLRLWARMIGSGIPSLVSSSQQTRLGIILL